MACFRRIIHFYAKETADLNDQRFAERVFSKLPQHKSSRILIVAHQQITMF
jgi:hypothetical protein